MIKFGKHPSAKLNELYKIKPYQGVNPNNAKIIFVGKDPNWGEEVDSQNYFTNIEEYLNDGVTFWEKYGIHHPFLLNEYKGHGRRYHLMFSKIGIEKKHADKISFIELIGFPTVGMASKNTKLFNELLYSEANRDHLISLDKILNSNNKLIFLAWGLIKKFREINKLTGLFSFVNDINTEEMDINQLNKHKNYIIHRHFSDCISNKTIKNMGNEIDKYLSNN